MFSQEDIIKSTFCTNSDQLITSEQFLRLYKVLLSNNYIKAYEFRSDYIKYSFPILIHDWINILAKYLYNKKVIEVACGGGWLTYWLRKYDVKNITAVDNYSWFRNFNSSNIDIINQNAIKYINNNKDYDAILMSWPNYDDPFAYKIAKNMKDKSILIYIGEQYGGCTGDDKFHDYLDKNFVKINGITNQLQNVFLSFDAIYDNIYVYYKSNKK